MPTRDEVKAILRAHERDKDSARQTPGGRYRMSELGRRLASGKQLKGDAEFLDVTDDPWELAAFLRNRSMADTFSMLELLPDAQRIVQTRPTPAALLPLCTLVPTSSTSIPTVTETFQVEDAAYTVDGMNLPGLGDNIGSPGAGMDIAGFTVVYLKAKRVGRVVPVPLAVLDDVGQAEAVVDRLITQNWRRAIENYALRGSDANLTGVLNTDGVESIDATSLAAPDALAEAVSDIQTDGFYGVHTVAAHPSTLKAIWTTRTVDGNDYLRWDLAVPTIGAWVPAPGLPIGTAIVGDFSELLIYLTGTFTISISQGYLDFISRGMALVRGEQRAAVWVRGIDAFRIVENIT